MPRRLDAGGAKVQRYNLRERRGDRAEAGEEKELGRAAQEDAVLGPQVRKVRNRAVARWRIERGGEKGEDGEHERGVLFRGRVTLRRQRVRRHRGGDGLRGGGSSERAAPPRRAEDEPRDNLQAPQAEFSPREGGKVVGAVFPVRHADPRVRIPRRRGRGEIAGALRGAGDAGNGAKGGSKRLVARQMRQFGGKRAGGGGAEDGGSGGGEHVLGGHVEVEKRVY